MAGFSRNMLTILQSYGGIWYGGIHYTLFPINFRNTKLTAFSRAIRHTDATIRNYCRIQIPENRGSYFVQSLAIFFLIIAIIFLAPLPHILTLILQKKNANSYCSFLFPFSSLFQRHDSRFLSAKANVFAQTFVTSFALDYSDDISLSSRLQLINT